MADPEPGVMACGEVLELLSDYVDGELDLPTRARVEAHVAECTNCARFGEAFAVLVGKVQANLSTHPVPDGVQSRIAHRLAR